MRHAPNRNPFGHFLEALEPRRLFSVAVQDGVLIVRDDNWSPYAHEQWFRVLHSDIWIGWNDLQPAQPMIDVVLPREMYSIPARSIRSVRVECGDWGTIVETTAHDRPGTFPLPLVLVGGAGDDILVGGAGDDMVIGGGGTDRIFGGAGADTLQGELGIDLPSAGYAYAVRNDFIYGRGSALATRDTGDFHIDYDANPLRVDPEDTLLDASVNPFPDPPVNNNTDSMSDTTDPNPDPVAVPTCFCTHPASMIPPASNHPSELDDLFAEKKE